MGLLATAVAVLVLVAPSALQMPRGGAAAVPRGIAELPEGARGPIAAALGRVQPAFWVAHLRAQNPAARLGASFTSTGVTIDSGAARVSLSPLAYGRGSALVPLAPATPRSSANRVTYARREVTEWYANGPLGLEQGFEIPRAPRARGAAPLTLAMHIGGNLAARLDGDAIVLTGHGVSLRYTGLRVSDARGRVLGSWLGLTGRRAEIHIDDRGARYPLRVDPFVQQAELVAGDGEAGDQLGSGVAIDGDTIVVSAGQHKVGTNARQGALYVFQMPAGGWSSTSAPSAELTAGDGQAGDELGRLGVAVSGDTIVAGAPSHKVGANVEQGSAYVFVRPPTGWASAHQTAELVASDGAAGDDFGDNASVSGNTVVVGGGHHKVGSNAEQGAAYVFVPPPGGWASAPNPMTQTSELTASDGEANNEFADDVAISGNTVVVGAGEHKVGGNAGQGAAYVFVEPPGGWPANMPQTSELTASDGAAGNELGYGESAVAISGNTVVAGAISHTVGGNAGQGAAYVFVEPPGGWPANDTQTAELVAADGNANDGLGYAVAAWGNTVVAGSSSHQVGGNTRQGAAYVFVEPPGGWASAPDPMTQTSELTGADGAASDGLGISVAVSGDSVLGGAFGHQVGANARQGAAYVFSRPGPSASISSPANGATYAQGQTVAAAFVCSDAPDGSGLVSCIGTSANGAPIETAAVGTHTFTVTATDSAGQQSPQSVTYSVRRPSPASSVRPLVSGARESHRRWREGKARARISRARRKVPLGTTFSFALNEHAAVTFRFLEHVGGRKAGRRCVAKTHKNAKHRSCTRLVSAGTLSFAAHAGVNKVIFQGRISASKKLRIGRYVLRVTATNATGQSSSPVTLGFTIVK